MGGLQVQPAPKQAACKYSPSASVDVCLIENLPQSHLFRNRAGCYIYPRHAGGVDSEISDANCKALARLLLAVLLMATNIPRPHSEARARSLRLSMLEALCRERALGEREPSRK